jgi:hypothetical protein
MTTARDRMLSPLTTGERADHIAATHDLPPRGTRVNAALLAGPVTNVAGELVAYTANADTSAMVTITIEENGHRLVLPWHAIASVTTVPTNPGHPAL